MNTACYDEIKAPDLLAGTLQFEISRARLLAEVGTSVFSPLLAALQLPRRLGEAEPLVASIGLKAMDFALSLHRATACKLWLAARNTRNFREDAL